MKKIITSFFVALLCFGTVGICQQATTDTYPELDFAAASKAFDQMLNGVTSNMQGADAVAKSVTADAKIAIAEPPSIPYVGGAGVATFTPEGVAAVRVWFELTDGRYVDPRFYRWAPGEMFYIHVQSAVPVYVYLYQNYRGFMSKQVYPDARYPHSFQPMVPGLDTRIPVLFRTDMNFAPEFLSIVVSRADSAIVQPYVPQVATTVTTAVQTAVQTVQTTSGPVVGEPISIASVPEGIWKSAEVQKHLVASELRSEEAAAKFAIVNTSALNNVDYQLSATSKFRVRCRVAYPALVRPAYYVSYRLNRPNYVSITNVNITNINVSSPYVLRGCYVNYADVAFYMFADHGVGQMQITFNKIGSGWRWVY